MRFSYFVKHTKEIHLTWPHSTLVNLVDHNGTILIRSFQSCLMNGTSGVVLSTSGAALQF
jgi:hypothetical protein